MANESKFKDISYGMSKLFEKHDNSEFQKLPEPLLNSLRYIHRGPVISSRNQLSIVEKVEDGLKKLIDLGFAEIVSGPSVFGPDSSNANDISKWQQKDVLCQVRITSLGLKVITDNK